ncbi:hypothetical protein CR513_02224, partial [Mucuna pruriens]
NLPTTPSDMKMCMMRAQIVESQEATMARFLHGLNIRHSGYLKGLSPSSHKVELQLKRKLSSKKSYSSSSWKGVEKEERVTPPSSSSRSSNIKCFKCLGKGHITSQCPNKRTMILKENREVEKSTSSSEVESSSDHSYYEDDLLMVRRLMSDMSGEETESQREDIFHSRCLMLGKLCSIIIDGERSVNVASSRLEERKYVDEVMCDVVLVEATHILLGRKVIHDDVTNKSSFEHMRQKVVLKSLSPMKVCKDQIKMRIKRGEKTRERESRNG